MKIKTSDIIRYLNNHPYFNNLSDQDKITVLNFALSTYQKKISNIETLFLRDDYIKDDGSLYVQEKFSRIGNILLESLRPLSQATINNLNITNDDYIKDLDDESKNTIFSLAIYKFNRLANSYYNIDTNISSITSTIANFFYSSIDYLTITPTIKELYNNFVSNVSYLFTKITEVKNISIIIPSYSMLIDASLTNEFNSSISYSFNPLVTFKNLFSTSVTYKLNVPSITSELNNLMNQASISYSII